jgi:hypothetical protein
VNPFLCILKFTRETSRDTDVGIAPVNVRQFLSPNPADRQSPSFCSVCLSIKMTVTAARFAGNAGIKPRKEFSWRNMLIKIGDALINDAGIAPENRFRLKSRLVNLVNAFSCTGTAPCK